MQSNPWNQWLVSQGDPWVNAGAAHPLKSGWGPTAGQTFNYNPNATPNAIATMNKARYSQSMASGNGVPSGWPPEWTSR